MRGKIMAASGLLREAEVAWRLALTGLMGIQEAASQNPGHPLYFSRASLSWAQSQECWLSPSSQPHPRTVFLARHSSEILRWWWAGH